MPKLETIGVEESPLLTITAAILILAPGAILIISAIIQTVKLRKFTAEVWDFWELFFPPVYIIIALCFWNDVFASIFSAKHRSNLKNFVARKPK